MLNQLNFWFHNQRFIRHVNLNDIEGNKANIYTRQLTDAGDQFTALLSSIWWLVVSLF